jgi:hypothetical protein
MVLAASPRSAFDRRVRRVAVPAWLLVYRPEVTFFMATRIAS